MKLQSILLALALLAPPPAFAQTQPAPAPASREPDVIYVPTPRAVSAVDGGEAVNPDGIRNQVEGGIIQSLSWTALEQVAHDERHRRAYDWNVPPIMRFDNILRPMNIEVIDQPGQPFLGTGEAAQGPAAGALANALAAATGLRLRDMPLSAKSIRTGLADKEARRGVPG